MSHPARTEAREPPRAPRSSRDLLRGTARLSTPGRRKHTHSPGSIAQNDHAFRMSFCGATGVFVHAQMPRKRMHGAARRAKKSRSPFELHSKMGFLQMGSIPFEKNTPCRAPLALLARVVRVQNSPRVVSHRGGRRPAVSRTRVTGAGSLSRRPNLDLRLPSDLVFH